MLTIEKIEKERLNHQAYEDCVELKEPQLPDNEVYMKFYREWRSNLYGSSFTDDEFVSDDRYQ